MWERLARGCGVMMGATVHTRQQIRYIDGEVWGGNKLYASYVMLLLCKYHQFSLGDPMPTSTMKTSLETRLD